MITHKPQIILMDNGSVKAEATLQLRQLAAQLSAASGHRVEAVSLRHADRISPAQLGGCAAHTLQPYLSQQLQAGQKNFIIIPLFFSLSGALTQYLPSQIEHLQQQFGVFDCTLADVIYPLPEGEPRLVELMWQALAHSVARDIIVLDHGSPDPQVTAVRRHLTRQLSNRLSPDRVIEEAVMERRESAEYDFNGELLETLLQRKARQGVTEILLLLQFLLPGRHAGAGGDIEQICRRVEAQFPSLNIRVSDLVARNPLLLSILLSRLQAATDKHSCHSAG
jgi:sirohydrochlorin ferrochelatase